MAERVNNFTVLLASTAPQKIDATLGAMQKLRPANRFLGRRIVLEEEIANGTKVTEKRLGLERFIPRRTLGIVNFLLPKEDRLTVVALKAASAVAEQPLVDRKDNIEEGFQGAINRLENAALKNALSPASVAWDIAIGIENAQVAMTAPGGGDSQIDIGFVAVMDSESHLGIAPSAGVIFGHNLGLDYFAQSKATGFTKPAGHFFSPEDPQNPHLKQTDGLLSRVDLLKDAIVIAYKGLPPRTR